MDNSIFWQITYGTEELVFFFVAITVLYMTVFSIASQFSKHADLPKSKRQNRFIVLVPAYKQDKVVMQAVNSILGQSYPQRMFDVVVISDHQEEMTNMRLAQLPITLLTPDFEKSSKAKSLQYAVLNLPQYKIYDAVLILDADNVVEPEFLSQMNDALESSGTKAIQAHRVSKNRDTAIARLDAIFEEINNSIFRRGHVAMGLSSAISGSGIAYNFEWFKHNIMQVNHYGEDKELEALLMRQGIFVDYFDDIHVYDEKSRQTSALNNQRSRWAAVQLHALLNNIHLLPGALFNSRYDLVDKIIQWMLIPRTILMGIIALMSIVLPVVYFTLAIKWWVAAAVILFAFSLATPNYLVDKNWDKDFLRSPIVIFWGLLNIARVGKTEADERLTGISHSLQNLKPKKKRKR